MRPEPSSRACGPTPPGGDHPRVRWPCGGRPRDDAEQVFLGGMRSARPRGKARRKPRDNIIIGGRSNARWPSGVNPPVQARSRLRACGARPSTGRLAPYGWPSGERPGMPPRVVFSEGRALRVRIARHHEWQGLSLPPVVRREVGGLVGIHGEGVRRSSRACGARPSAGG
jgi:hypothetical protein